MWEHLESQECLDHREQKEIQVHPEKEAMRECPETWDLLDFQVLRAHLVYLVNRVSEGQMASRE